MELTVYRQSSKTRPDGTVVYKGEDALPYVDGSLIMAADGLGGAAAIRHTKVRPELFDEERLVDTLFGGVLEGSPDEVFSDYVRRSFFELRAVKDIYSDNVNNIKKSGYFASRIVTAIVLHEVRTSERLKPEVLFGALEKEKDGKKREEFLAALGGWFRGVIKEKLTLAAENANLVYESAYTGLALLGTTLCAAIYRENKGSVEAVYITAGDSRPYVWSRDGGLCQLIADEERADGGMTNYIRADEGSDFTIRCTYKSFEKPCVLFNASDGCFDSGAFLSPMAFEKLLLDTAAESADTEEMSRRLTDFFLEYGRHDDSSTIAMRFFGYKDFSDFRKAAEKRLSAINDKYISRLDGLLENDYAGELERVNSGREKHISMLGERLKDNEAVVDFCRSVVRENAEKSAEELAQKRSAELKERLEKAKRSVVSEAARNLADYISLIPGDKTGSETKLPDSGDMEHILAAGRFSSSYTASYLKQLEQQREAVSSTAKQLDELLGRVSDAGVPDSVDYISGSELSELRSCEAAMANLFGFLGSIRSGSNSTVRSLVQRREEYENGNRSLAEKYPEAAEYAAEMLISGEIPLDKAALDDGSRAMLETVIDAVRSCREELDGLEADCLEEETVRLAEEYWSNNSAGITEGVLSGDGSFPEELSAAVKNAAAEAEAAPGELEAAAQKQAEIFEEYYREYSVYMAR
ncbi:MAG: SpoIIE family protein phosphatase [Ruminococcus sp.]|nr:SpoIIE family protein phosphatase [Ruminococcus sp.]